MQLAAARTACGSVFVALITGSVGAPASLAPTTSLDTNQRLFSGLFRIAEAMTAVHVAGIISIATACFPHLMRALALYICKRVDQSSCWQQGDWLRAATSSGIAVMAVSGPFEADGSMSIRLPT